MRQRLAITISSAAAAVVLAVGLSLAGFGPVNRSSASEDGAPEAAAAVHRSSVEPEVVYIEPAPPPRTVTVNEDRARSAASSTRQDRSVARTGFDDDDDDEDREDREDRAERAYERAEYRREKAERWREHDDDDDDDDEHDD